MLILNSDSIFIWLYLDQINAGLLSIKDFHKKRKENTEIYNIDKQTLLLINIFSSCIFAALNDNI